MSFTSKLGSSDSKLGNIQLGSQPTNLLTVSLSNTLVFSQTVSVDEPVRLINLSSILSFSQSARGFNGNKRLSQSLALSQIAASQNVLSRSATHVINFIQAASGTRIVRASNTISFVGDATVFSYKGTNDQLAMTQVVAMNWNHAEGVSQALLLTQSLILSNIYNRNTSNLLTFNQLATAIRARFLIASNVIAFQDFGSTTKIVKPSNNLVIVQSVTVHKITSISVSHLLALHQTTIRNMVFNLTPSNVLKFNNSHPRDTQILGQHQIISVPTIFVTKPSNTVLLATSNQAITLKRPLIGDSEGGLSKVLLQRTITGSLFTYVRKNSSRKLKYTFEIPKVKALELRGFIRNSLSSPMWLQNWKGEIWFGFITNNPFNMKGKQRWANQDGEAIDVNIEFEGVKIHG